MKKRTHKSRPHERPIPPIELAPIAMVDAPMATVSDTLRYPGPTGALVHVGVLPPREWKLTRWLRCHLWPEV
jgi:hypothetical protein